LLYCSAAIQKSQKISLPGQNKTHKGRCFCADKGADVVLRKNIEKFEIMPQSPSCGKQEVM